MCVVWCRGGHASLRNICASKQRCRVYKAQFLVTHKSGGRTIYLKDVSVPICWTCNSSVVKYVALPARHDWSLSSFGKKHLLVAAQKIGCAYIRAGI